MGGGLICGIGDFRQEKGAGNFGQFRVANEGDPQFARIKAEGGREAQDDALEAAEPYDEENRGASHLVARGGAAPREDFSMTGDDEMKIGTFAMSSPGSRTRTAG